MRDKEQKKYLKEKQWYYNQEKLTLIGYTRNLILTKLSDQSIVSLSMEEKILIRGIKGPLTLFTVDNNSKNKRSLPSSECKLNSGQF